ncbi:MAG: hypothetical protein EXR99_09650 [Gemmataceae bacterium]|nr:hypothetical protein [Gemmataceae bacterium]
MAAWDTAGQIYFSSIEVESGSIRKPVVAPGHGGARKHPALAAHSNGDTLLTWTEGTGWERGGALVWQVFDAEGKAKPLHGRVDRGIGIWGLPAAVATPEGFLIFH